jgi:DNA/RNA endonuclease YhcR with UshA esterase domain
MTLHWAARLILFQMIIAVPCLAQNKTLSAREAKDHVGQKATVCGEVASAHYAERTKGQPTFINLDEPYPHQIFTALIWGSDRSKFGTPETALLGKKICVTGTIMTYRGEPEVVVSEPSQIEIQK